MIYQVKAEARIHKEQGKYWCLQAIHLEVITTVPMNNYMLT